MATWDFPTTVSPGELAQVYVERHENGPYPAAEVNYTVTDSQTSAIQLQYRMLNDRTATSNVQFETIHTMSTPEKRSISIGFSHNIATPFVLAGDSDSFVSNDVPVDWMHRSLGFLGCLPLRQICIPGTHDSGMSKLDGKTAFSDQENTVTQKLDVGQQLRHGARYFDIRPVKAAGRFKTGHYSGNDFDLGSLDGGFLGWLDDQFDDRFGGNGQSIDEVISQVNDFTKSNKELIILRLSHAYDTDDGYKDLSQGQWDDLLKQMSKINYLFQAKTNQDLTRLPLAAFIADSASVVVIVDNDKDVDLKGYAGKGFFKRSQFEIFDSFADTDDQNRMIDDQLGKLRNERKDPDSKFFLLSWTLTQQAGSSLGVPGRGIMAMADQVFPRMFERNTVWRALSKKTYPNVIMVDSLSPDSRLRAFALAINRYFAPTVKGLGSCKASLEKKAWKRDENSWVGWLARLI